MSCCSPKKSCCSTISTVLMVLGFLSILASIVFWYTASGETAESVAHAERFGIFVGLWAPTFFALSVLSKVKSCPCAEGVAGGAMPLAKTGEKTGCCQK